MTRNPAAGHILRENHNLKVHTLQHSHTALFTIVKIHSFEK